MVDMTPEAWRDKLLTELARRTTEIQLLERYYDGDHPLPKVDKVTDEYRRLAEQSQANMCGLVVDAVSERLALKGIRVAAGDGQAEPALDVWVDTWQANGLDAESTMVHDQALKVGRAFVLVWPEDADDGRRAVITPEDPTEVIVAYRPGSRRDRVAALKVFRDDDAKARYATLWLPERIHRWQQPIGDKMLEGIGAEATRGWEPWEGDDEFGPAVENPFGVVPIVEFRCRPNLRGKVNPEISIGVRRLQDSINKTLFDRSVLSEFQAFPQRYTIGIEVEVDPESGKPINPLKAGPDRVWALQPDGEGEAKIGQLEAAKFEGHLKMVEADIQHLAAITKTPVYYLMGQMINVSADAIRAAEAGLIAKVRKHQLVFGEAWEDVVRLALLAVEDPRAGDVAMEVSWVNPEARSMAELADAATKKQAVGVPWRQTMTDLGYTDQEIEAMRVERAADALLNVPPEPVRVTADAGAQ